MTGMNELMKLASYLTVNRDNDLLLLKTLKIRKHGQPVPVKANKGYDTDRYAS